MKIVPAVLSDNLADYSKAFSLFEQMDGNEKVHIDVMDGEFVNSVSPDLESILKIPTKLKKQVHLMAKNPIPYVELCIRYGVREVIVHFGTDYEKIYNFGQYDLQIFMGINPENKFTEFGDLTYKVSGFLIMTVHPGLQGQPFLGAELEKVNYLRTKGFDGQILVDGSVNKTTITQIKQYPLDEAVVGSAIIKQPNPIEAYTELVKLIN